MRVSRLNLSSIFPLTELHSNFQGSLLIDVLRYARIEPAVNQVELHPYLAQKKLVALCKELGIAMTAYSSLGPQSYLELGAHHSVPGLLSHDVVTSIANATAKSPAQVLLRWTVQQGIAVIPKSNSHERLLSNLQVTSFELTPEQVQQIDALDINLRVSSTLLAVRLWLVLTRFCSSTTLRISTLLSVSLRKAGRAGAEPKRCTNN